MSYADVTSDVLEVFAEAQSQMATALSDAWHHKLALEREADRERKRDPWYLRQESVRLRRKRQEDEGWAERERLLRRVRNRRLYHAKREALASERLERVASNIKDLKRRNRANAKRRNEAGVG